MTVRLIASAVIAALMLLGFSPSAVQSPEAPGIIAQVPAVETKSTAETVSISQTDAEKIALAHAGLTEQQVNGLRAEYDRDDRVPHWDVNFREADWEYDYEIGEDGTILKWDKEYDPVETPPESQPTQPAAKLTAENAKALALAHAGLTEQQVNGLRAEYDRDDGIPVFEVEFYADGYEYDYDIHAETGVILSWDKEWDD